VKVLYDTSVLEISRTGVGNYVQCLLASLKKRDDISILEMGYRPVFSRKNKLRIVDSLIRELVWYDQVLDKKAMQLGADIIHCPAFDFPIHSKANVVITIHDIYSIIKPQNITFWHRNIIRHFITQAIEKERQILLLTEFTKIEILTHFPKANSSNLHVIHSGISGDRYIEKNPELFETVAKQYGITKPYFLSISTIEPRKNFNNLLKAFATIVDKVEHTLLMVGESGWMTRSTYNLISELKLENRVVFTGFVPDKYLNTLYSNASCFVFPSFYEGFGFTPLEAMKCGCPVASSKASCMPEVLGNAAEYFDPHEIDSMATAMLLLSEDEEKQNSYRQAGILQASRYNWDNTATATADLYKQIAG
jgi:glycosyltransferase involved in cell wall biosynthesis